MAVDVRWATTEDAAALAAMLCEMAVHYRQPPLAADRALAAARKWLAEESPAYPHFALAFVEGEVSGLASVAIAHPGIDLERLLFLKDLFVRDKARNAGIGRALIGFLADDWGREGIGRIELSREEWKDDAVRFYSRLGAERHGQKIVLRLSGESLAVAAKP